MGKDEKCFVKGEPQEHGDLQGVPLNPACHKEFVISLLRCFRFANISRDLQSDAFLMALPYDNGMSPIGIVHDDSFLLRLADWRREVLDSVGMDTLLMLLQETDRK
ncbi:hypothetical protein TNCV_2587581 [Trichonephila clavipes]|nr:hypothetical protein TNCV_2587581 [Trichonephila clavipes]